MSAYPESDIECDIWNVRQGPKADMPYCALRMSARFTPESVFCGAMSASDPKRKSPAAMIQRDKERPIPGRRLKDWEHQTCVFCERWGRPVSAMDLSRSLSVDVARAGERFAGTSEGLSTTSRRDIPSNCAFSSIARDRWWISPSTTAVLIEFDAVGMDRALDAAADR